MVKKSKNKLSIFNSWFFNNWPLLFLFAIGILLPISWFKDGRIIGGGDQFFYYNPTNVFSNYFYSWLEKINLGEPNYDVSLLFPVLFFFKIFKLVGFSNLISEIFWAIYLFLFPGYFMYLLVLHLIGSKTVWSKTASLAAGMFYMFNPYAMSDPLAMGSRPAHVAYPLLFLLWVKGIEADNKSWKFSIYFAFSTLLFASTETSPAFIAPMIITPILYLIYAIVIEKKQLRNIILFSFKALLLCVIFNLWWIVPSFFAFTESGKAMADFIRAASDFTHSTKIWEAFRLMGFWASRIKSSYGMDHIPYAHNYYQFPLLFVSFIFPVLAFGGLLIKSKNLKAGFFALLFLLSVFLAKGVNSPFGFVFESMYKEISFFSIFRNPYSKFTPMSMFSLSVLLGISWGSIIRFFNSRLKFISSIFILGLILFFGFPLITGNSFQNPSWHGITKDSLHVEIPQYWFEIAEWFKSIDSSERVMQLPKSAYGVCYNWKMGTCSGEPMGRMFLPNQVVKYPGSVIHQRDEVLNKLYDSISPNSPANFGKEIGSLGIKYILQQNDIDWKHTIKGALSPEETKLLLSGRSNIKFLKSIGELDLYSVNEADVYPLIYCSYGSKGEIKKIPFRKINPTRYEINVEELKLSCDLIFLSSFSKNWKLYLVNENILKNFSFWEEPVLDNRHFIAREFANGWYLKTDDLLSVKNSRIYIEYLPQRFTNLGFFVSSFFIIFSIGYLLFLIFTKSKK